MTATPDAPAPPTDHVAARLSTLDRFLPVWIGLAMVAGLVLGRLVPGLGGALSAVEVDGVSLPIALGLLVMMYPVLAKVRYDRLDTVTGDRRMLVSSLVLNWVVGPALMFALAWVFLLDLPEYRTGLIIVGLARCIAMVIIWNDLACGDREAAAVLVALNSVFQVVAFGALGWFYLSVLPGWLGLPQETLDVSPWQIAASVLVFLGIPLLLGYLSRRVGEKRWGRTATRQSFLPRIGPWALYGLLFTIVVLFALQGDQITSNPLDVARIALPLLVYFALMWGGGFLLGRGARHDLRAHHDARLHRRRQQLRARHRGRDRHLRRHLRPGARRRRRPAHRGARARRPRLRLARPPEAVSPRPTAPMTRPPSVLFVCVHNAGRSQMAAAWLQRLSGGAVEVRSAGCAPADAVNPAAVAAMLEVGIDIAAEVPKVLTTDAVRESDVVITMGCGDACPIFPGKRYEDWAARRPGRPGRGGRAPDPRRDPHPRRRPPRQPRGSSRSPDPRRECGSGRRSDHVRTRRRGLRRDISRYIVNAEHDISRKDRVMAEESWVVSGPQVIDVDEVRSLRVQLVARPRRRRHARRARRPDRGALASTAARSRCRSSTASCGSATSSRSTGGRASSRSSATSATRTAPTSASPCPATCPPRSAR